jgi:hypothetical protein
MAPSVVQEWLQKLQSTPQPFVVKFRKINGAIRVMQCAALGTAPGRAKKWTPGHITDTVWTVVDVDVDDWRSINVGSIFAINSIASV